MDGRRRGRRATFLDSPAGGAYIGGVPGVSAELKATVQLALLLLCLFALGAGVIVLVLQPSPGAIEIVLPTATPQPELKVYVSGAVNRPGVYLVQPGDRLEDVLAFAGGLTEDADLRHVNHALRADDETHFYVPRIGEQVDSPAASPDDGRVNINTASAEELEALPGIGPGRAEAIIERREVEGPYARGEDLLLVPGLGPKTVEGILDLVTVD